MTILEVLTAKLKPYFLPEDSLQVLLIEQDLDGSDDYDYTTHKTSVSKALLGALEQCKTLTEESDNGSTQKYDVDAITERAKKLEDELSDEDSSRPQNIDLTEYW